VDFSFKKPIDLALKANQSSLEKLKLILGKLFTNIALKKLSPEL
jgi:hypothetical protein